MHQWGSQVLCVQVLRSSDPKLAKAPLKHAGQLLDFGARYQGSFTQSVPEIGAVRTTPPPLLPSVDRLAASMLVQGQAGMCDVWSWR